MICLRYGWSKSKGALNTHCVWKGFNYRLITERSKQLILMLVLSVGREQGRQWSDSIFTLPSYQLLRISQLVNCRYMYIPSLAPARPAGTETNPATYRLTRVDHDNVSSSCSFSQTSKYARSDESVRLWMGYVERKKKKEFYVRVHKSIFLVTNGETPSFPVILRPDGFELGSDG